MAEVKLFILMLMLYTIVLMCTSGKVPHEREKRATAQPQRCPDERIKDAVKFMADNTPAPESLKRHTLEFTKERIEVRPGVHFFIGYAMANSIIIEAPEGLIVVDTTDGEHSASEVMKDLRGAGVTANVKAIIYTHNHPDHVGGTRAILKDEKNWNDIEVWSYETLVQEFWSKFKYNRALLLRRSIRMFGGQLRPTAFINAGLGATLESDDNAGLLPVPPNRFLRMGEQSKSVNIAGLKVVLIHIPGETRDQMAAYFPTLKTMAVGDDFYKTFPNLYSIRGTPPRPVEQWIESIDRMLTFDIEYIVPSHTKPVVGKANIIEKLTNYRDGIQFVFDQTIRLMNKGLHPDEVAQSIQLPPSLRSDEHLLQHYGTVEWSSKTIFEGQLGWFSGYPQELFPLTPKNKAPRWVELVGAEIMLTAAETALAKGRERTQDDVKWALLLATQVWNAVNVPGASNSFLMRRARAVRTESLLHLASYQTSPNGRNYLMSWAFEENCIVDSNYSTFAESGTIEGIPVDFLVRKMATMLQPEKVYWTRKSVLLNIVTNEDIVNYSLNLRNAVLDVKPGNIFENFEFDIAITIDEQEFRNVLNKRKSLSESSAIVMPSALVGDEFMSYFDDTDHIYF